MRLAAAICNSLHTPDLLLSVPIEHPRVVASEGDAVHDVLTNNQVIPMTLTNRTTPTLPTVNDVIPHRAIAALGVLLMLLLVGPNRAQAQQSDTRTHWKQHLDDQAVTLIESSDPALRADGMQMLINLSAEEKADVDFSATRNALYGVLFDRTYADEQRILALSALHAIGGDRTVQMMADEVNEVASDRVRRHLLLALEQNA